MNCINSEWKLSLVTPKNAFQFSFEHFSRKMLFFKWKFLTILFTFYFSDSRHRQVEHWQRGGVLGHLSHERRWDVSRTRNSSISKKKLVIKKLLFSAMFQPSFSPMSKRWINKKLFALNDDFAPKTHFSDGPCLM